MIPADDIPSEPKSGSWWKNNWVKCFDAFAKIVAAFAVAGVALIAHNFESSMSATSLLNEREQAETNLRATLLHDLITTVTDRAGTEKGIDIERELVLVSLLTLNFHDHFEFKPLLIDLDQRFTKAGNEQARQSLQSIARRVVERQVNQLQAIGRGTDNPASTVNIFFAQVEKIDEIRPPFDQWAGTASDTDKLPENTYNQPARFIGQGTTQIIRIPSPDEEYFLGIGILGFNKSTASAKVYVMVQHKDQTTSLPYDDFTITPYDFPLTDNTQIDGFHRFALSLYHMDYQPSEDGMAEGLSANNDVRLVLRLVWFPKGFITEQERPVNYLELRKWLGLDKKKK